MRQKILKQPDVLRRRAIVQCIKSARAPIFIVITLFAIASCTTSSQVPLSVRQRAETEQVKDTSYSYQEDQVVDEERLMQQQEAAKITQQERNRYIAEAEKTYKERTNKALTYYSRAQSAYFRGNHQHALQLIRFGLQEKECADLLALKGSVHYTLGNQETAVNYWKQAVALDEEVVCDMYPGIKDWYALID